MRITHFAKTEGGRFFRIYVVLKNKTEPRVTAELKRICADKGWHSVLVDGKLRFDVLNEKLKEAFGVK